MAFAEYTTSENEKWDNIARKAYGDATQVKDIMAANPSIAIKPLLAPGIKLLVPIKDGATVTNNDLLPPWKQTATNTTAKNNVIISAAAFFQNIQTSAAGSHDKSFDESFD